MHHIEKDLHVKMTACRYLLFLTSSLVFNTYIYISADHSCRSLQVFRLFLSISDGKNTDHACPNLAKCVRDSCLHLLAPVFWIVLICWIFHRLLNFVQFLYEHVRMNKCCMQPETMWVQYYLQMDINLWMCSCL